MKGWKPSKKMIAAYLLKQEPAGDRSGGLHANFIDTEIFSSLWLRRKRQAKICDIVVREYRFKYHSTISTNFIRSRIALWQKRGFLTENPTNLDVAPVVREAIVPSDS